MADAIRVVQTVNFRQFNKEINAGKKQFFLEAMEIVTDDIIKGIEQRMDATGKAFPALEESTIKRKKSDHPLIHRGALKDAYTYKRQNNWRKNEGVISVKPITRTVKGKRKTYKDTPRDRVAFYLQVEGVKPKDKARKFYRFFGISNDASLLVLDKIDALIDKALRSV